MELPSLRSLAPYSLVQVSLYLDRQIPNLAANRKTAIGPVIGGFVTQSSLGWRWTAWITMIASAVFTVICYFTFPETFEPILLTQKAKKLRLKTGNQALHSKREEDPLQVTAVINRYLMKPYHMFFKEPIV